MSAATAASLRYKGSRISLVSSLDIRYEGILYEINSDKSTVSLQDVRCFGTEDRRSPVVPPTADIYPFVIFRGPDIKDLTVFQATNTAVVDDPAIVSIEYPLNSSPRSAEVPQPSVPSYPDDKNDSNLSQEDIFTYGSNKKNTSRLNKVPNPKTGGYTSKSLSNVSASSSNFTMPYTSRHRRGVYGELRSKPNSTYKKQVADDFDFVEANSKLTSYLSKKLEEENAVADGLNKSTSSTYSIGGYNKETSFFDSISCESLDVQHGRDEKLDKNAQRAMDLDTFGNIAATFKGFHRNFPRSDRNYYRRGRGYRSRPNRFQYSTGMGFSSGNLKNDDTQRAPENLSFNAKK